MLQSNAETALSQVRKSAHEEVQSVVSRIATRTHKLTRRQSIDQSIERHNMSLTVDDTRARPIFDNRCRSSTDADNPQPPLLSPIPNNGLPPQLLHTKQQIKSMVTARIQHHREAELLIQKAEDALVARIGTQQNPTTLLNKINKAIAPLQSQRRSLPPTTTTTTASHLHVNLNHPMRGQTNRNSNSRLNTIEKIVHDLSEYSVSTIELRAALQIVTERTNVRAKKIEHALEVYKDDCMTKKEAALLFQSKKNNAKFVERAMEIATNQVRTVIGSEVKSILKNEWNDMTSGVDGVVGSGGGGGVGRDGANVDGNGNGGNSATDTKNVKNVNNEENDIVSPVELQMCFAQNTDSPDFHSDLHSVRPPLSECCLFCVLTLFFFVFHLDTWNRYY